MQVYRIYNTTNNKSYVGITKWDFETRYSQGKWWKWTHSNQLKSAVKKHGLSNFKYEILWEGNVSLEELIDLEKLYIQQYNSFIPNGYNLTEGGGNPNAPQNIKEYELIDCFGNLYRIKNLSEFCKARGLNYGGLLNVVCGAWPVSQGFALSDYEKDIPNPNKEITVVNIETQEEFSFLDKESSQWAKDNNLNPRHIRQLIRKKTKVHKNFKLKETDLSEYPKTYGPIKLKKDDTHITIDNIYQFCKDNGFDRKQFYRLIKGEALTAYGYSLAEYSAQDLHKKFHERLGKEAILIDPNGKEHHVKNISEFCRQHNLKKGSVYCMIKGRTKTHKGWTHKK